MSRTFDVLELRVAEGASRIQRFVFLTVVFLQLGVEVFKLFIGEI